MSTAHSNKRKKSVEPVKKESEDKHQHRDKKPTISARAKPPASKRTSAGHHLPQGYGSVTSLNSFGRRGLCVVLRKTPFDEAELRQSLEKSPGFLTANDKGAHGLRLPMTSDALAVVDAAFDTLADRLIAGALFSHAVLHSKGVAVDTNTGLFVHPEEQAAQGKTLAEKSTYLIKTRNLSLAAHAIEEARGLLGDVKMPEDTRPVMVMFHERAPDTSAAPASKKKPKAKKGKAPGGGDVSVAEANINKVLKDYNIKA
jgi:hypothetical protein